MSERGKQKRAFVTLREGDERNSVARLLRYEVRPITGLKLWKRLTRVQQRAALDLREAFLAAQGGMRSNHPDSERVDTSLKPVSMEPGYAGQDYWRWAKKASARGIDVAAVIDVIGLGKGSRQVDRERHKRNGWAIDNLIAGLEINAGSQTSETPPLDKRAGTKL